MMWQLATRGPRLRHLSINAITRPARVIGVQNGIRRDCLAAKPRQAIPLAGSLSTNTFQLPSRAFVTAAGRPRAGPKAPPKPKSGRKASSAQRKKSSSTKKNTTTKKKLATKKKTTTRLSEQQREARKEAKRIRDRRALIKSLKEAALEPPKKLPVHAWNLAIQQQLPGARKEIPELKEAFRTAAHRAKAISEEEKERINTQAEENKAANAATFAKWLQQHTPLQIKEANRARRYLARLQGKRVHLLHDDRLVKKPLGAFFHYVRERTESGDFKHMKGKDIGPRCADEWNSMTEAEKQRYQDLKLKDRARFEQEYRDVYGKEPRPVTAAKSA